MFDDRRSIGKAVMIPGQPTQIRVIPPVTRQHSGRDESMDYGANALVLSRNNNQAVPGYSEKNSRKEGALNIGHIDFEGHPFGLGKGNNTRTIPPNLKDFIIEFIASIPPEIIEAVIKLLPLLLVNHTNVSQSPPAQVIPTESHFRDMLQLVLAAYGIQSPAEEVENRKVNGNVKIVFDEIIRFGCDIFQKVDLTKALQKKLKAKEIDTVLEFLISEGGVLDKVEQKKRSNGRSPSPQFRLLWNNPKYYQMHKS